MTIQTADHPVRIAITIASRGRPAALAGAVMTAQRLQSGANQVAFTVAVDDDDVKTIQMIDVLRDSGEVNLHASIAPREPTLAGAQNRAIGMAAGAEIVTPLTDRAFVITPGWDVGLVDAAIRFPNRVLWWSCPHDPDTTMPIFPHTLLDRTEWRPLPEIFPFWYTDTWWAEVDRMCFGGPSLRIRPMFAGARGATTRGRDFAFWSKTFAALRPRRVEQAKNLAAELDIPWKEPPADMVADFEARDRHLAEHAAEFQERFGDASAPDERYLEVKAAAEAMVA